jgi:FlaA1/EpsC-like NDP-sugar epimerase
VACVVGDVKDTAFLDRVFSNYRPRVVFHAAAYKHVPLMEGENAWQAVRNNVLGSKCLAQVSQRYGVEKMVLISTDKAVNPTNVMGATKRLAERVLCGLQQDGTRFVTVRFGNVLGSNGSVIPKFHEQIARGGPLTVTHPEIIRYFMLIPEAAQLVLQAGLMGHGGEIFVLEMGEPIRIVDLARDMIRLSGFSEEEISIEFTGLRPGEKLYEELLTDSECTLPTPHSKLRVALADAAPDAEWQQELCQWLEGPAPATSNELKRQLQKFVPEYAPQLQLGAGS